MRGVALDGSTSGEAQGRGEEMNREQRLEVTACSVAIWIKILARARRAIFEAENGQREARLIPCWRRIAQKMEHRLFRTILEV